MRQRQLLLFDIPFRETRTRVTFTHQCMALPPFLSQDLCPQDTMTDIRLCAETLDARGITTEDTDVMQHRCFLQELLIEPQFRMCLCDLQTAVGHLSAMN